MSCIASWTDLSLSLCSTPICPGWSTSLQDRSSADGCRLTEYLIQGDRQFSDERSKIKEGQVNPLKGTSSLCILKMEGHPAQGQVSLPFSVVHGQDPGLLDPLPLPLKHRQMIMTRHLHRLQRHFGLKFGLLISTSTPTQHVNSISIQQDFSRKQEPALLFCFGYLGLFCFGHLRSLGLPLLTSKAIRGRWRQRQHGVSGCEIGGAHHVFNPFLFKVQTAVHFNFASSPAW